MSETVKRQCRNWRSARKRRKTGYYAENFPLIEKIFYCYKELKKEIAEIHAEQTYYRSGFREGGGDSNHAFISDPTSQIAIRNADGIKRVIIFPETFRESTITNPEKWVFVVDQTLKHFKENDTKVYNVMERRYFKNESYVRTCSELNITDVNDYYNLKDAGLKYARDCAIQMGLIKVF